MPGVFYNGGSTNSVFGAMSFSLNGVILSYSAGSPCFGEAGTKTMSSISEFTSLFEKYSIRKIVIKWIPRQSMSQQLGLTPVNSLYFNVVKDYDDDATTFSQNDLLQRQNVKYMSVLKKGTTILVPAAAQSFYDGAVTTAYGQKFKPWLSCASYAVPHYGIKFFAPGTAGATDIGFKFDISVKMYYAFKQVK